ncbi:F0F1 ATP synthase subunit gamma [Hydrogenophaga sp. PAMC20947]|uniref:F0F1 ATP synthase subunit gamma n=1 Tax=Hydrogenophaga sp. PAMC20947 TaxID=2565558 RepID=UPI00109E08BF|nr:F0F1 ATP synthase subunit gamma [Hydrogenophaga sp. PAMC20947]QCB45422.1 F0F1 ATP synthase subunit gamma [Hydrogenophaga sp. PAMC20947]
MADSTAHLRRKIGSASDLHAVVRAMKAQAAASVGQYAQSVAALGDYARTVELGLGACFRQEPLMPRPHAAAPAERRIRAVVFGSDQGLVGRFNDTLVEHALPTLSAQAATPAITQVWAVGSRMQSSLADADIPMQGSFTVPATVKGITRLVTDILVAVIDTAPASQEPENPPELHLFYNRPTGGAGYSPVSQRLLPLDDAWRLELAQRPWPTAMLPERLGSAAETLRALINEFVFVSIYRASAESLASENASRLAAMDRADRNIDKMLLELQERFHRLRQSKIDEELSDVIAGFKALSE